MEYRVVYLDVSWLSRNVLEKIVFKDEYFSVTASDMSNDLLLFRGGFVFLVRIFVSKIRENSEIKSG